MYGHRNIIWLGFVIAFIISGCKKTQSIITQETGTLTDIDNNIYATVKIGNQWWMAENLRVTKYRNGNPIQEIHGNDAAAWSNTQEGAYCEYSENHNAPGFLYNWFAVTDTNNLAPAGWHIPTDDEWKTLEIYLGMSADAANKTTWRGTNQGDQLKISGTDRWTSYGNVWPTNESGFSAMPGGCRVYDGSWSDPIGLSYMGFWWSSSVHSVSESWYRYLDYKNSKVFRSHALKSYGFSIRCVKN